MSEGISEGWVSYTLEGLGTFKNGLNKSKKDFGFGTKFVNISDAYSDKLNTFSLSRMNANEKEIADYGLDLGDLVFVRSSVKPSGVGYPTLFLGDKEPVVYCGFMIRFRTYTNATDKKFLLFLFRSDVFRKELFKVSTVSANTNINQDALGKLRILLPTKPEQQKIASILTSVDEVIEKTEAQISKLQDLKKGMMQELLTKGIGHTEFKDSPVGRIPKEWKVLKLGSVIASLEGGVSVNGENRPKKAGEFGVLKVSSVNNGQFRPEEYKTILQSNLHRAKLHPKADYILFSRANTPTLVGESGYVEETRTDLFLPDKLWLLDVTDRQRVSIRWLSYVLIHGSTRKAISDAATGTSGSMKNISKPSLLSIIISVPSKYEQDKIADSILSVDRKIGLASRKLKHTSALKQALMQDLLTGKVRVKVN